MHKLPKILILGRPNVGKSTLFNLLSNTRKALVKDQPGVTRDLQFEQGEWLDYKFEIIDSGGVTDQDDVFSPMIRQKVESILSQVDIVLLVMDGRAGLCVEDKSLFQMVQRSKKEFYLLVNKLDQSQTADMLASEFYEFGVNVYPCSFEQRIGVAEVLDQVVQSIPKVSSERVESVNLSIVGKPNVGKSSLCNLLLGEDRLIVSDVAGTTVDSIDCPFRINGKSYILIDTAGLRKKRKRIEDVEVLSSFKSRDSIKRANICLLLIDGTTGPTEQDAKIAQHILEEHKALILVVNKTDLGEENIPEFRKTTRALIADRFHFYPDLPICFVSAKTSKGIEKLFNCISEIEEKLSRKISTRKLNDFFKSAIRQAPAPFYGVKTVKFYYLTQTEQRPPSFIAFANHPDGVTPSYRRFLVNRLKEAFDWYGVPLRIFVMKSRNNKKNKKDSKIDTIDHSEEPYIQILESSSEELHT